MIKARHIISLMNNTQEEAVVKALRKELDSIGIPYLYDSYVGWILTDGYLR